MIRYVGMECGMHEAEGGFGFRMNQVHFFAEMFMNVIKNYDRQ